MVELLYLVGGVLLGTAIWLWILRRYDRVEPESIRHLLQVGIVGGLLSIAAAAFLNEAARVSIGLGINVFEDASRAPIVRLLLFTLMIGIVEEVAKAVSAVLITRRLGDLDEPVDAMIYAMTVALGFASFENVFYALRFGNDVLLARFLWPVPAHMAYAALWGYGWAVARFVHPNRPRILVMAPSLALAAIFHAAANFLLFLQHTVTAVMSLAALAALAILAHYRLRKLVAESPFLEPGECVECRYINAVGATICVQCGEALGETEIFVTCPCGSARIAARNVSCPYCGLFLGPTEIEEAPSGEEEK